jgi:hypothetical protein
MFTALCTDVLCTVACRTMLCCAVQGPDKEARLAALTGRIAEICGKRGVMIKPFFDDAAQDEKSGEQGSVHMWATSIITKPLQLLQ